jgi:hypothetical protein
MKKALNIIFLLLFSALSSINYLYLLIFVSSRFVLGDKLIHGYDATMNWVLIVMPVSILILSILTGVIFYFLHKKKLKKIKIGFSLLQLLLFAYSLYKIIEITSDPSLIPIPK